MKIKKKILAIIYRRNNKKMEFLALKNNPDNPLHGGNFYFVVTGGVDKNEGLQKAVKREVLEETGIKKIINIIDLHKIDEYVCLGEGNFLCRESEFLVEVDGNVAKLNEEHVAYKWLKKNAFVDLIAWKGKKDLSLILRKI